MSSPGAGLNELVTYWFESIWHSFEPVGEVASAIDGRAESMQVLSPVGKMISLHRH